MIPRWGHGSHGWSGWPQAQARRGPDGGLRPRNGQTLRELCAGMEMVRQSVSKHLAVLEAANLVTTVWRGCEKLHYLNPAPINDISERWLDRYEQQRVHALAGLKRALESPSMDKPSFVYTTYIQTTRERLWEALTSRAFTDPVGYLSEGPGLNVFALSDNDTYLTYATIARGLEPVIVYYGILDRTPSGRDEGDPPDPSWIRHHNEYDAA
jgi:DNA-binding transcriptional ArsR family regulator